MWLALTDLFRSCWTDPIHAEWMEAPLRRRPDLTREDLERTRSLMNAHVRDSLVAGFEHFIATVELPDAGDRRVVAAAIHCGASAIVTFNVKHFPPSHLAHQNLAAQHPDDFIAELLERHPGKVREAAARHRQSLRNPPKSADQFLDTLLVQGLPPTVTLLRSHAKTI